MLTIALLSGPFKAGKSTLADELIETYGYRKINSGDYLRGLAPETNKLNSSEARAHLQDLGDELDAKTDYKWIVDPVAISAISRSATSSKWLVDAVRKERQVAHFRALFDLSVTHIHIFAPEAVLLARSGLTPEAFARATSHSNEVSARGLWRIADKVFDSSSKTPQQIAADIAIGERDNG